MQIKSTLQASSYSPSRPSVSPTEKRPEEQAAPDSFSRDDLYTGGAALAGGLTLGAGGAYLGMSLGIEAGMRSVNLGGGPVGALLGVLVSLPVAMAYGVIGCAAGGAVGAVTGVAAGVGLKHAFSQ